MAKIQKVGVVGCGLMGRGIAQVCAAAGYETVVREIAQEPLDRGMTAIEKSLDKAVERGKLEESTRDATLANLRGTTELEDLFETFLQMTYSLQAMQNARVATLDATLRRAESTGASAEVLAGLVYVNLIRPGHPAIFGPWPFVSDLRTGAMSGGSGEQALLTAACAQMGQFYDLPVGVPAGMSDAKLPDAQAGYEKGMTNLLAAQAGSNLIYESAGMHASLLGCCLESFVVDNDMLGAILRTVRGIEVTDDSLSLEAMREVCLSGPNHFLGRGQTLELMQAEYLYPEVACRRSPKEWIEHGSAGVVLSADGADGEPLPGRHGPAGRDPLAVLGRLYPAELGGGGPRQHVDPRLGRVEATLQRLELDIPLGAADHQLADRVRSDLVAVFVDEPQLGVGDGDADAGRLAIDVLRRQVGEGQKVAALEVTLLRLEALTALLIA